MKDMCVFDLISGCLACLCESKKEMTCHACFPLPPFVCLVSSSFSNRWVYLHTVTESRYLARYSEIFKKPIFQIQNRRSRSSQNCFPRRNQKQSVSGHVGHQHSTIFGLLATLLPTPQQGSLVEIHSRASDNAPTNKICRCAPLA